MENQDIIRELARISSKHKVFVIIVEIEGIKVNAANQWGLSLRFRSINDFTINFIS